MYTGLPLPTFFRKKGRGRFKRKENNVHWLAPSNIFQKKGEGEVQRQENNVHWLAPSNIFQKKGGGLCLFGVCVLN